MKTDSIFYTLFARFPEVFFELIDQDPSVSARYRFDSIEVKQLAFRLDGVFLPQDPQDPIHFVEVQFWPDDSFYTRLITESILYLSKTKLPNNWQATVIFPTKEVVPPIPERYQEFFDSGRIKIIILDQLDKGKLGQPSPGMGLIQLIMTTSDQAGSQARRLTSLAQEQIPEPSTRRNYTELVESILIYKFPQKSQKEIAAMLGISDIRQTKVYQEGRQEGRQAALEQTTRNMLAAHMDPVQIAQLTGLPLERIQQLQTELSSS